MCPTPPDALVQLPLCPTCCIAARYCISQGCPWCAPSTKLMLSDANLPWNGWLISRLILAQWMVTGEAGRVTGSTWDRSTGLSLSSWTNSTSKIQHPLWNILVVDMDIPLTSLRNIGSLGVSAATGAGIDTLFAKVRHTIYNPTGLLTKILTMYMSMWNDVLCADRCSRCGVYRVVSSSAAKVLGITSSLSCRKSEDEEILLS